MSMHDRAAQFSPFAALTGYGDCIDEAGRFTESAVAFGESDTEDLNRAFQKLLSHADEHPHAEIVYFLPDAKKEGGTFSAASGNIAKIRLQERWLQLEDGTRIDFDKIISLQF